MATTQLELYNEALRLLGERKIASLTENRSPRRLLDDVWSARARDKCLEMGLWNFATRTTQEAFNSGVSPSFGFQYAFDKPSDYIRTVEISDDEYFHHPLLDYHDEGSYWFADVDTIYLRYVSNDSSYGYDYSLWPEHFTLWVAHYLADAIRPHLKGFKDSTERKEWRDQVQDALRAARSHDASNSPTQFPPPGSWVTSRTRGSSRRDRGSRTSLTG